MIAKKLMYPLLGAVCGFLYYKFVGCPSGACPITANPYTSTIYGALIGLLAVTSR